MAEGWSNNQRAPVCQYFLNSNCRYGSKCRFRHVYPTNSPGPSDGMSICRYFLQGNCRFGDNCWNRHESPASGSSRTATKFSGKFHEQLCAEFAENARCALGNDCYQVHGERCKHCHRYCLHPFEKSQRTRHTKACTLVSQSNKDKAQIEAELEYRKRRNTEDERRSVSGKTCAICLDVVCEKPDPTARRFGVLESCDHVFCFGCIMKWRQVKKERAQQIIFYDENPVKNRNSCPVCRTPSEFVAPSSTWFASATEKRELIADHKNLLATRHCKAFRRGRGHCPRGSSCYNLHQLLNGQRVQLPPPRNDLDELYAINDSVRDMDFMGRLLMLDFLSDHEVLSSDSEESYFVDEWDGIDMIYDFDWEMDNFLF